MKGKIENRIKIVEYNINLMQNYLKSFKNHLDTLQSDTIEEYLKEAQGFRNVVVDLKYMSIFDRNNVFLPKMHYSSFLLTWFSFVESELIELCSICEAKLNLKKSAAKLRGIYDIKMYLSNDVGISINQERYKEINIIREIRNKIAHLGPNFDKKLSEYEKEELKNYIEEHGLIREEKYKSIYIHYDYCMYLLELSNEIFFDIGNKISTLYGK